MPKLFKNQSIGLVLVASSSISFLCSSCSNLRDDGEKALALAMQAYEEYDLPATLPKTRSNVRVKVSLSNRMAYVMEGGTPLLVMPVTVGRDSAKTPTGSFRIRAKTRDYRA
ncbi:L,D-transpeptidase, partial [Akkermansiaceae bacterium]|nr:L,D-transpeptidase [Akkermansiaceae bacterium]